MPDNYLLKYPTLENSQNYSLMYQEGIELIIQLAHKLWTDYNIHDPGITFLQLFCYALTDLGYRTGYDIKDILTESENGEAVINSNFHTALPIFSSNPISFDDLSKLLIDIEGIKNAWIEKQQEIGYGIDLNKGELKNISPAEREELGTYLNGLYDVFIQYEEHIEDNRILKAGQTSQGTGGFILPNSEGLIFDVYHPITLHEVSIYIDGRDTVTIQVLDESDTLIHELITGLQGTGEKQSLTLNFDLPKGNNYKLIAQSSGFDPISFHQTTDTAFPHTINNLLNIHSGVNGNYAFFYDWNISFALSPLPQIPKWEEQVILEGYYNEATGSYDSPDNKGIQFEVEQTLRIESVSVRAEQAGWVVVRLLDEAGHLLQSAQRAVSFSQTKTRVALGFELEAGTYILDTTASSINLFQNESVNFAPLNIPNLISLSQGTTDSQHYIGLYDWEIRYDAPQILPEVSHYNKEDIKLAVKDRLNQYRNLCEDFIQIKELEEEKVAVCAEISLLPDASVEEVLAEIYYQLDKHIAPEVKFYTIQELLAKGKTTDQIFEGPILDHGFIDDDEFQELIRPTSFKTSDIIQIIMDIEGVSTINEISLLSLIPTNPANKDSTDPNDYTIKQADWILELSSDKFRAPIFAEEWSNIIFYKNKLPYYANQNKVQELLNEKKAQSIQTKLTGHEKNLPIPIGEYKELENYYPAQNDLPEIYRVGQQKLPSFLPTAEKAAAKQLKAYLTFFEQTQANYLSQLANVKSLFSWEPNTIKTYFTQALSEIHDLESIYIDFPQLQQDLEKIIEDESTALDRKNKFLDHLLARFAESLHEYQRLMEGRYGQAGTRKLIGDKQALLADYPQSSRTRAKANDYRCPLSPDNITGFQHYLYRLLGIHDIANRTLAGHRFYIDIVEVDGEDKWHFYIADANDETIHIFESIPCESEYAVEGLLDFALEIGGNPNYYQEIDGELSLAKPCEEDGSLEILGKVIDTNATEEIQAYFAEYGTIEGFHLVEHILLRKRFENDGFLPLQLKEDEEDCDCVEVKDPYSFRMSILLPSWPQRFKDIKFRKYIEDELRLKAPAHIFLKICWISHMQMKEFESIYQTWQIKLADIEEEFRGELPLPTATTPSHTEYQTALKGLIEILHDLDNIHPVARLHDCETTDGDDPQITLNNTTLGTF